MVKVIQFARACLAAGAFSIPCLSMAPALAGEACGPAWQGQAEKTAELGFELAQSWNASDRVRFWRMVELGEDAPNGRIDLDFASTWHGTWQDESDAYQFMMGEAAVRGVSWPFSHRRFSQPDLNMWFAAKLFTERRDLLGEKHPYLKQWLENQQAVFMQPDAILLDASGQYQGLAAELAADDVRYQRAAQRFYAEDYAAAADQFHALAAQPKSRYRSIAAYMAARSRVHGRRFDEALADIATIEGTPELADVRMIAEQLIGVISWNAWYPEAPAQAMKEAARRLLLANARWMRQPVDAFQSDPATRIRYWQGVLDLEFLLKSDSDRRWLEGEFDDDWWLDPSRNSNLKPRNLGVAAAAAENDLVDWLQSTEQVRVLASGPWLGYWSSRANSPAYRAAEEHVHQRAEASGSLAWIVADAMRARDVSEIARKAYIDISGKLGDCSASQGELLALGPLRYHVERMEIVGALNRYSSDYFHAPDIATLDSLDPHARIEAIRFLLALSGDVAQFASLRERNTVVAHLLSRDLHEFISVHQDYEFSDAPSAVLNMMPARVLLQLATDESVSKDLRPALVRMAWTRAYLLHDGSVLGPATDLLPKLNPGLSELVDNYRGAWTESGRRAAALRLLLKAPTMQQMLSPWGDLAFGYNRRDPRGEAAAGAWSWFLSPAESATESVRLFWADGWNPNDGNWWCHADVTGLQAQLEQAFYNIPLALMPDTTWWRSDWSLQGNIAYPVALQLYLNDRRRSFLASHPVLKLIDWEELGKLSKVPAAPEYLSNEVTAWVKESSWLDRWLHGDEMAEALALVVRATRYGCHRDGPTSRASYAAYRLLHELFPDSEAARHTRYWYR
jgi:hypothetical protein